MAALAVYAARTNRSDDVVLITANHGRANEKLGKIAGMFVATLPIRIQLDQNQDFLTLAKNIESSVKTILKTHTRYPFDQLITDLRERSKSFTGNLSDIAFVLVPEIPLNDVEFEHHVPGDEATPIAMHFFYRKKEENFLTYDYQTDLFDAQDIQNLHESLFTIIKAAIISPDNAVSTLPLDRKSVV